MASIDTSAASDSTWREKIVETGKKVFSQISSLFSVITLVSVITKIKDAGVAVVDAIRSIEINHLNESLGIFQDWFSWFLASIFALKFTDTGKAFLSANSSVLKAMFLIRFISFMTTLLATLFQMHKRNIAPLVILILFESGASILAASLLSRPALWISLTLWLFIFVLFGYCCYIPSLATNPNPTHGVPQTMMREPPSYPEHRVEPEILISHLSDTPYHLSQLNQNC